MKTKIKSNYIVISLITVAVALLGSYFTSIGMPWYETSFNRPQLIPPSYVFPIAWNLIFICATISAIRIWNLEKKTHLWKETILLFIINAILNVSWTYIFFVQQNLANALAEIMILILNLALLVNFTYKQDKPSSYLLLPYLGWICFATYLTWQSYLLN